MLLTTVTFPVTVLHHNAVFDSFWVDVLIYSLNEEFIITGKTFLLYCYTTSFSGVSLGLGNMLLQSI